MSKKRGRKPREISYMNNTFSEVVHEEDPILHLPISLESIQQITNNSKLEEILLEPPNILQGYEDNTEHFQSDLQEVHFENQGPLMAEYSETVEDDYINKEITTSTHNDFSVQEVHNSKVFPTQLEKAFDYSVLKNMTLPELHGQHAIKVDTYCWWCCHPFDSCPVYLPIKHDYNRSTHKEFFRVKGCFCSYNCALAYGIKAGYTGVKALLVLMRKLLDGIEMTEPLSPAPAKEVLTIFGGPVSIEEFRESFTGITKYDFTSFPFIHVIQQTKISRTKKINSFQHKEKTEISETKISRATERFSTKKNNEAEKQKHQTLDQIINISYE
jgi:hypothetical protein